MRTFLRQQQQQQQRAATTVQAPQMFQCSTFVSLISEIITHYASATSDHTHYYDHDELSTSMRGVASWACRLGGPAEPSDSDRFCRDTFAPFCNAGGIALIAAGNVYETRGTDQGRDVANPYGEEGCQQSLLPAFGRNVACKHGYVQLSMGAACNTWFCSSTVVQAVSLLRAHGPSLAAHHADTYGIHCSP
jgi:hypothetical protein